MRKRKTTKRSHKRRIGFKHFHWQNEHVRRVRAHLEHPTAGMYGRDIFAAPLTRARCQTLCGIAFRTVT